MSSAGSLPWTRRLLEALQIEDFATRQLFVLGVVAAAAAERNIDLVLVGGAAQAFYTMGGYATRDLDVVCAQRESLAQVLEALGFQRDVGTRHWYHPQLDTVIEIPDEHLAGAIDRIATIQLRDLRVPVIGVEDLVLDRLRAAAHWKSQSDREWAARLLALHASSIDWPYLEEQAHAEGMGGLLDEVREQSRQWGQDPTAP